MLLQTAAHRSVIHPKHTAARNPVWASVQRVLVAVFSTNVHVCSVSVISGLLSLCSEDPTGQLIGSMLRGQNVMISPPSMRGRKLKTVI